MALANGFFGGKTIDVWFGRLPQNGSKNQKTLIPLHFGNRELHNKLLAHQHPNMG
jgi:hypothetical protein